MQIFFLQPFTFYRDRNINLFHAMCFHGDQAAISREPEPHLGDEVKAPLELYINIFAPVHLRAPIPSLVASQDLVTLLAPRVIANFQPVKVRRAVSLPYSAGEFPDYETDRNYRTFVDKDNPYAKLPRNLDVCIADLPPFYRLLIARKRPQRLGNSPSNELKATLFKSVPYCSESLEFDPQLVLQHGIADCSGLLAVRGDIFELMSPYIDFNYFYSDSVVI